MSSATEELSALQRLKQERGAIILAHTYQRAEIQLLADYVGDSLELARKAAGTDAPVIVFCGVRFMAETAKILAPDRTVLLPAENAGCPMADSITAEDVRGLKKQHPGASVVAYVNSTAEVKAESDYCCTSANALQVVESVPADEIICIPDRNLAQWCQKHTSKRIIWWDGCCPVHEGISREDVLQARETYADALLLAHPECEPEVLEMADEVMSTSQMITFARRSLNRRFLIATEEQVAERLQAEFPDRICITVGVDRRCVDMKKTRIEDVVRSLKTLSPAVEVGGGVMEKARLPIERMLALG